jgi:hypothetical protein
LPLGRSVCSIHCLHPAPSNPSIARQTHPNPGCHCDTNLPQAVLLQGLGWVSSLWLSLCVPPPHPAKPVAFKHDSALMPDTVPHCVTVTQLSEPPCHVITCNVVHQKITPRLLSRRHNLWLQVSAVLAAATAAGISSRLCATGAEPLCNIQSCRPSWPYMLPAETVPPWQQQLAELPPYHAAAVKA